MSQPYAGALPIQFQRCPPPAHPLPAPSMQSFSPFRQPLTFTPSRSSLHHLTAEDRSIVAKHSASRDPGLFIPPPGETLTSSTNPYHVNHADRYRAKLKFPLVYSPPIYNRLQALKGAEDSHFKTPHFRPTDLRGAPEFKPGSKNDDSKELISSIQDALQYTRSKFDKGERPMRVAQFFIYPDAHSMAKEAQEILQEGQDMGCANKLDRKHLRGNSVVYEIGVPQNWKPEKKKKRARAGKMYDELGFAIPFPEIAEGRLVVKEIRAGWQDDTFNKEDSLSADSDDQPKNSPTQSSHLLSGRNTQSANRLEGLQLPNDDGKPLVRRSLRASTIAKHASPVGYAGLDDEEEEPRRTKPSRAETVDDDDESHDAPRKRRGRLPKTAPKLTSTKRVTRSQKYEWEDKDASTVDLSDVEDEDGEFRKKRRCTRGAEKKQIWKYAEDLPDEMEVDERNMVQREPRQTRGAKVNYTLNDGEEMVPFDNDGEDDEFGEGDGDDSDED